MPYKVVKSTSRCSDSKPWAVVKEDDNSVMGCHNTEAAAKKQQSALYAQEKNGLAPTVQPGLLPDLDYRSPWAAGGPIPNDPDRQFPGVLRECGLRGPTFADTHKVLGRRGLLADMNLPPADQESE